MLPCLYLLDEPHVQAPQGRLELSPARPTYLLMYLGCRSEWVSREVLAELLWPDSPEDEARHNLRVNLHRAKALPWAAGLEVERERLRFLIQTDVAFFRQALGQADWMEAVRWHQRPFLEGFLLQDSPAFEEWASLERQALLDAWRGAALKYSEALQQQGEAAQSANLLSELLRQDFLAEDVLQSYMHAAYLAGQRDTALKTFERFAQKLKDELGLEPMQDTLELAQSLRRSLPLKLAAEKSVARIPLEVLRPPRLMGREAEESRLKSTTLALLAGEPGVGKTRLLQEVFPEAPLLRGREGLENLPFFPVLEYLRSNLDRLPDLGLYHQDLARLIPELASEPLPPADPLSGKTRLLEALSRALGDLKPIVFDDLQWADPSTLELLVYLANAGKRLIAAYRAHEVNEGLAKTLETLRSIGAESIPLAPLNAHTIQKLLADLMGNPDGPPLFSSWLHQKTGGNPFFALETLKALFESRGCLNRL